MKTKNVLHWALVTKVTLSLLFVAGCGKDSESKSSANGNTISSTRPAGSSTDGGVPSPSPAPDPDPTDTGGDRAVYSYSQSGNGPANTTSSYVYRTAGLANNLGLDSTLRVQLVYGAPTQSRDPSGRVVVGGIQNYRRISANVTLLVDGIARESIRLTTDASTQKSNIGDFSGAFNSYKRANSQVSFRFSDIQTDWKTATNHCTTDYNNCCVHYWCAYNPRAHQVCSDNYFICVNNSSPVSPVSPSGGWSFSLKMETDMTTPRLTQ